MKKLIAVGLVMVPVYVYLLRAIALFITRDKEQYLATLEKVTDTWSREEGSLQERKEFLHRQTLEKLTELVCSGTDADEYEKKEDGDQCYSASEHEYIKGEVAKIEDMLKLDASAETNLKGSFIDKEGVVDRKMLVYDIWYKRILADILLYRERQVPYLSSHIQAAKEPFLRHTKARFADFDDMTPLAMSIGIGAALLVAV